MSAELDSRAAMPPDKRGSTQITERVLERIASQVLTEAEDISGVRRRLLRVPPSRDATDGVTAWVDGGLATVRIRVSMVYPAPVREVSRHLRENVTAAVERLTGLDVRQVDIEIARFVVPEQTGERVM